MASAAAEPCDDRDEDEDEDKPPSAGPGQETGWQRPRGKGLALSITRLVKWQHRGWQGWGRGKGQDEDKIKGQDEDKTKGQDEDKIKGKRKGQDEGTTEGQRKCQRTSQRHGEGKGKVGLAQWDLILLMIGRHGAWYVPPHDVSMWS